MWVAAQRLGSGRRQTEGSEQRLGSGGGDGGRRAGRPPRCLQLLGAPCMYVVGRWICQAPQGGDMRPTLLKGRWHSPPAPPARPLLPEKWPQVQGIADGHAACPVACKACQRGAAFRGQTPAALPHRSAHSSKFIHLREALRTTSLLLSSAGGSRARRPGRLAAPDEVQQAGKMRWRR